MAFYHIQLYQCILIGGRSLSFPEALLFAFNVDRPTHALYVVVVPLADCEASPGSDGEVLAERSSCSLGSPADLNPAASMDEIQVELQCADLWKRFHDIGTEMIITKAGRYSTSTEYVIRSFRLQYCFCKGDLKAHPPQNSPV